MHADTNRLMYTIKRLATQWFDIQPRILLSIYLSNNEEMVEMFLAEQLPCRQHDNDVDGTTDMDDKEMHFCSLEFSVLMNDKSQQYTLH